MTWALNGTPFEWQPQETDRGIERPLPHRRKRASSFSSGIANFGSQRISQVTHFARGGADLSELFQWKQLPAAGGDKVDESSENKPKL